MKEGASNILSVVFAPVLSGILLVLAFPVYNFGWLAWLALVPILVAVSGKDPKKGFLTAYLFGFVFFPAVFSWILQVSGYTYLHHLILAFYLSGYFGFWGMVVAFVSKHRGIAAALLTAPFAWVFMEFVRSHFFFLSLPWALLAHTQYQYPPIIQVVSWTGTFGISFLIVMVNSAVSALILFFISLTRENSLSLYLIISGREVVLIFSITVFLAGLALFYGFQTIAAPITRDSIKVSVVQGNIDQTKKWNPHHRGLIMQTYSGLTRMAAMDRPLIIVWPETATPSAINLDPKLYDEIRLISKSAGTYLLSGSAPNQKFTGTENKKINYMNSAFLISPDGKAENQRYDKIRLLPFGEYLPMEETIPWSVIGVPRLSGYTPGKEFSIFETGAVRFGVTICWENIFPDLVRQFVKKGASFIVNITNEAWFGKTSAPYHFVAMSVFRAAENGVSVVRCANTGISCFINPNGKIMGKIESENRDIFVAGYLTKKIFLSGEKTFYTVYGDVFAYINNVIMIIIFFFIVIKSRADKKNADRKYN
ncbi:MAG: apolipoprotein N-acyltransferase [Desulfobacterales bacterium]